MQTPNAPPRPAGRRRPLPHAYLHRSQAEGISDRVDRRDLLRAAEEAGRALTLPCSAKTLLSTLAACYGEQQLAQCLLVWPSNAWLVARTGLPERTLRDAILRLRTVGVIAMVDSPNGKRFARRKGNSVVKAFGFDLAPVYDRRAEWAAELERRHADENLRRALRHDLSAVRKEIEGIVHALHDTGHTALAGRYAQHLVMLVAPRSRHIPAEALQALLAEAENVRTEAERSFYRVTYPTESTGSGGENRRHKESNTDSSAESCQRNRSGVDTPQHSQGAAHGGTWAAEQEGAGTVRSNEHPAMDGSAEWRSESSRSNSPRSGSLMDVELWRTACPDLAEFQAIRELGDVAEIGGMVSRFLQLSPHGLESWRTRLGPALFPLVAAYVFQVCTDDQRRPEPEIRNSGGFFCYVAREVSDGSRDLALDLMALRRRRLGRGKIPT